MPVLKIMQSRKTGEQNIQNIHYAYDVWYGSLLLALSARCADLQMFFQHCFCRVFCTSRVRGFFTTHVLP